MLYKLRGREVGWSEWHMVRGVGVEQKQNDVCACAWEEPCKAVHLTSRPSVARVPAQLSPHRPTDCARGTASCKNEKKEEDRWLRGRARCQRCSLRHSLEQLLALKLRFTCWYKHCAAMISFQIISPTPDYTHWSTSLPLHMSRLQKNKTRKE